MGNKLKNEYERAVEATLQFFPALNPAYYRSGEMEHLPEELQHLPDKFRKLLEALPHVLHETEEERTGSATACLDGCEDRNLASISWVAAVGGGHLHEKFFPRLESDQREITGLFRLANHAEEEISVLRGQFSHNIVNSLVLRDLAKGLLNSYSVVKERQL